MTVTSLTLLSADPPRLLVNIHRRASPFSLIQRDGRFAVNILGFDQRGIADRFSNGRLKGKQRFENIAWSAGQSGMPLLGQALAAVECEVDEIIERFSHGIVIGRLLSITLSDQLSSLVYWNGQYVEIKRSNDLDLLADVRVPPPQVR